MEIVQDFLNQGFRYAPSLEMPDRIVCTYCNLQVYNWSRLKIQIQFNATLIHLKYSNGCRLMRRMFGHYDSIHCSRNFSLAQVRHMSMIDWIHGNGEQSGSGMAQVGFYTVNKDIIRCHWCQYQIVGPPSIIEDPVMTHVRLNPGCEFIKSICSADYFNLCLRKKIESEEPIGNPESGVCVICFERPITRITIPCGHASLCGVCAINITKECPICKAKNIINTQYLT